MRDSRRAKLYRAEWVAKLDTTPLSLWECEVYAKNVLAWGLTHGLKQHGKPTNDLIVKDGRGCIKASCSRRHRKWCITLPVWARTRWVVIHEVCHALTWGRGAPHGWEFARTYLLVVEQFLGKDAAKRLKFAFKAEGVRSAAPRTRVISPEQREILVARLAACRQAKASNLGG